MSGGTGRVSTGDLRSTVANGIFRERARLATTCNLRRDAVRLERMFTALREPGSPNMALSDLIALFSISVSTFRLLSRSDRAQFWFLFHFVPL